MTYNGKDMIAVGEKLWWVDYKNNKEGTVVVTEMKKDHFVVLYNGRHYKRPYTILNRRLFKQPQLRPRKKKERTLKPSCSRCMLRRNGTCTSLSDIVCPDFRPAPSIRPEEQKYWPEFGDATAIRLGKLKRFS